MSPRMRQGKTPPQTAPTRGLKPPRPFVDPAARPETVQTPDPDFETRIERAARYGHSLDRITFPAGRPLPPGGPVVQRMKRKQTSNDGKKKKKQKTTDQRPTNQKPIASFFKTKNQQQPVPTLPTLPPPQQILPTTPSVSNTDSDLGSVSNLVHRTNSTLTPPLNLVPKIGKNEVSNLPTTNEQPKKNALAELMKKPQHRLTDIRKKYPHLANVPDDWIELGAKNDIGPPIHLKPPPHLGPNKETMVQREKHAHPYIIDLSTGEFTVPKSAPYKIDRDGVERGNLTRSDVRNYAMLTNAYLSSLPEPPIAQQTKRKEKGSLGWKASEVARQERNKNEKKYGKGNVVAHVPDSSISGVPYSPMGLMRMTDDANTIVGYSSRIGLKALNKERIGSILVKELVEGKAQYHYYTLPSNTNDDTPSTTISNTSSSKHDSLSESSISYVQDDFWNDEAFDQLDEIEKRHTDPQKKNEKDNL